MARRRSSSPTITRTIVARAPAPIIRVSAPAAPSRGRRIARAAGRGARTAGRAALREKDMLIPIVAAAGLGYAEAQKMIPGFVNMLPFSPATNIALISYGIGKWSKNRLALNCAVGFGCVAANRWASGAKVSGEGVAVHFDDDE